MIHFTGFQETAFDKNVGRIIYSRFSLFMEVMFYKAPRNTELMNIEPLLLQEKQG